MALNTGDRLGPYEIVAPLGAGGMGEVYRARDARLQREVALKVLPAAFAQDPERIARFEREAKLLASLNHPRIGALYGLEESEGRRVLVLELVAGQSLAERLHRGALPLDEALPIACQIASALEAAHESGVVHRDLKPGNVMLRPDGTIKVLDFGLAKGGATEGTSSDPQLSASPTMTYAATQAGVILGTAAYMSPEQARGRAVDRRSDIWSFGCLLFELLTGRQAFGGETVSDTLAGILKSEPEWSTLPPGTPRRVVALMQRCLRKDPSSRLRDAGDARIELEEVIASPESAEAPAGAATVQAGTGANRGALALLGVVAMAALAFAGWTLLHGAGASEGARMRFTVQPPDGITATASLETMAISPDGSVIAYVGQDSSGASSIRLRRLATLGSESVPGTDNAIGVFWSPDNQQLGFFADGKLKTILLASGIVRTLCDAPDPRGATWGSRGMIVFTPAATGPMSVVSAEGGEATVFWKPDSTKRENSLRYPSFLPDGRHFLFTALPRNGGQYSIWMGELGSQSRRPVMQADAAPVWAGAGHLVTTVHDRLVAVPFDPGTGKVTGKLVDLGDPPLNQAHDAAYAVSASLDGKLLYCNGSLANTELVWLDRTGRRVGSIPMQPGRWETLAISPDGKQAVVSKRLSPSESKLWIVDTATGQGGPLGPASAQAGINWSPDGKWIAYQCESNGTAQVFVRPSDGGAEHVLTAERIFQNLWGWSPDSKTVLYSQPNPGTNWDVMSASVDGSSPPVRVISTPASEAGAVISPDGHWMAYVSDESGRREIYIRSYPEPGVRKQLGSTGLNATFNNYLFDWSHDGTELFVASDEVVVYPITLGPPLQVGPAHRLFPLPASTVAAAPAPDYRRVLVSLPLASTASAQIAVEANWWAALKKK